MQQGRILSSLLYKFSERIFVKALGLIISIILARLLSPTVFGQIAIVMVFINLSNVLLDSGLSVALVQNKDTSDIDYSTVFYISLSVSLILSASIVSGAPLVAEYYDDETLVTPLRMCSLILLFGAVNSITTAKLQREMRFKQMMWCNLLASVLSGFIGVMLAYSGYGIWSLIAYYLSSAAITCALLLITTRWYPLLAFSWNRAKTLFSFGWKMLVSGLLCSIYNDMRSLIVGKVFSPTDLGYYNRGEQFPNVVSNTLDNAIQSVMFPVMSSVQDDGVQVKSVLKKTFSVGVLLITPVMMAMAVMAEPLVDFLLTSKWLPAVPYMQSICIGCITIPMTSSCLVAIKALGRSDVYMKLELVRRLMMLAVLLVSIFCFRSVLAIAVGFAVSSWLDYLIISVVVNKLLKYRLFEQLADMWKQLLGSVLMCLLIYAVSFCGLSGLLLLVVQFIVGFVSYLFFCRLLKISSLDYMMSVLFRR